MLPNAGELALAEHLLNFFDPLRENPSEERSNALEDLVTRLRKAS